MAQARCCWCQAALVPAMVLGLRAWVCPTQACRARQLANTLTVTKGKVRECRYVPLPSQMLFEECGAKNILWGGQAGPGKSYGIRWWLYKRSLTVPNHQGLILRENYGELETTHLRDMARELPTIGARFVNETAVFPNGSIIDCGHMADAAAVRRYLSTEYGAIVCDEASQYPVGADGVTPLTELSTRARKVYRDQAGQDVLPRFLVVSNPGGPSAAWLKDMFIDHAPDYDKFKALRGKYRPEQWVYIAAKLDDNPYQPEDYETTLANTTTWRYEQLRHGDWSVFGGQFFQEWTGRTHSVAHAQVKGLDWFCSMDWGFNAPGVILWWACLPDGHYHIAKELKFQQETAETVGRQWHGVNRALGGIRPRYVAADPSMWAKTGHGRGEAIAESLQRLGLPMRRGDNDRKNGWQRCHELLRLDAAGVPWLTVDPIGCPYLTRTLPAQMSDRLDPDDVDTKGDDHAVDAWRYGAMSRPSPTRIQAATTRLHPMLEEALAASVSRPVLGSSNVRAHAS